MRSRSSASLAASRRQVVAYALAQFFRSRRPAMRTVLRSLLALLLLAPALPAQTRTVAERLGYPQDAKLLILHADDLGAAHSIDAATFDALDKGVISSASIMMPTPWV